MEPNKSLLSTTQAADLIGVEPRTLECWRQRGDGPPFVSISRRCVRYDICDLHHWIDDHKKQSTWEK
ncbi:MAG: helix-turn-helix domain-containing protein [Candidatus Hinthialibacter antarcticus]|nr:helix-turn-helix domain-containing protein [Candidatus Hinthialibacter antarcticus]